MRQAISRAVADCSRTIRIPVHVYENITKITKAQRELTLELGREPTDNELSKRVSIPVEKINNLKKYGDTIASLDTPVACSDGDYDTTLADYIKDDKNEL